MNSSETVNDSYLLVMTTCPDQQSASKLARALVDAKLAACVQVSSAVTSVYQWQGEVCEEQEFALQIKCHQQRYDELAEMINRLHPYEVPELIATQIVSGSTAYLDWIKETTQL
ncbi:divalent-cation tolerance protein CutA [Shewanella sp. Isolate11]|uniref:divalent-cation tolerance protein CutA n=1 Tax=Shewanella sp. Isolate11 TaxID=2908530 RepID=UPI001EFE850A|nr:divalent-cation tolerance protein CutA [Shewanella sp. Isolate11]MCG9695601.1 divalent-cation tolerance protein CutA [Shewanella sp. Isolate11]